MSLGSDGGVWSLSALAALLAVSLLLVCILVVQRSLFNVSLVYEGDASTAFCRNWFLKGERPTLIFRVTNPYYKNLLLNFYLVPLDFKAGNASYLACSATVQGGLLPNTQTVKFTLDAGELKEGLYTIEVEVKDLGLRLNGTKSQPRYNFEAYPWTLAIMESFQAEGFTVEKMLELVVPHGLGVNIHFVSLGERESTYLDMIKLAGFRLVRMDLFWDQVERSKGMYDFSGYLELAEGLRSRGIAPLYILDYSNALYDSGLPPHTDEGRGAFSDFAANATRALLDYSVIWEIWNEPNIAGFWKPEPNVVDYTKLALEASERIYGVDKSAVVIAPASSGVDTDFIDAFVRSGALDRISAVSVHPYRSSDPETVSEDYASLRRIVGNKTVVCSEWGYPTSGSYGHRVDITTQAKYLVRMYLVNLMNRVPITIVYDWKDDGSDPNNSENSFGTLANEQVRLMLGREGYLIKPAYYAIYNVAKNLSGFKFSGRIDLGDDDVYLLRFEGGGAPKFVVWARSGKRKITLDLKELNLTSDIKTLELIEFFGWRELLDVDGNAIDLEVDDAPAIICLP